MSYNLAMLEMPAERLTWIDSIIDLNYKIRNDFFANLHEQASKKLHNFCTFWGSMFFPICACEYVWVRHAEGKYLHTIMFIFFNEQSLIHHKFIIS